MGIQTMDKICDWPEVFQMRVNNLTGLDSLKFTMGIWNSGSPLKEKPWKKELKITIEEDFHIWIWKCIGEKRWTEIMSTSKTQSSSQIPQWRQWPYQRLLQSHTQWSHTVSHNYHISNFREQERNTWQNLPYSYQSIRECQAPNTQCLFCQKQTCQPVCSSFSYFQCVSVVQWQHPEIMWGLWVQSPVLSWVCKGTTKWQGRLLPTLSLMSESQRYLTFYIIIIVKLWNSIFLGTGVGSQFQFQHEIMANPKINGLLWTV